jgi:hypothetical protein
VVGVNVAGTRKCSLKEQRKLASDVKGSDRGSLVAGKESRGSFASRCEVGLKRAMLRHLLKVRWCGVRIVMVGAEANFSTSSSQ